MSALVGVIMGSKSDWSTLSHTADMLEKLGIPYEVKVVSAHRTPDLLFQYAEEAEGRGIEVIIAGAGGAAHLPGMCAAKTHLPVLGVPVQSVDALGRRFAAVDRADAGGHSGRHPGHRQGRRDQRRAAVGEYPGRQAPAVPRGAEDVPRQQTDSVLENPDPRIA